MDEAVPCSSALAIAVGSMYLLGPAEDDHKLTTAIEAVEEQAHLDEADAQSDTGSGTNLFFQAIALEWALWFPLMTGCFAQCLGVLKGLRCFQSPASQIGLRLPVSQGSHHFRRCEDQSGDSLSMLEPAILPVHLHLAFAASAEDVLVFELLVVPVFVAWDAAAGEDVAYSDRRQ